MIDGSVSVWQLFLLGYFVVLFAALLIARSYRRWKDRETRSQFDELMRRRASSYEMLKIISRESQSLAAQSDEDLQQWLVDGPTSRPEGQALRDVDTELEILQDELLRLRLPGALADPGRQLAATLERARKWVGSVLGARTVEQARAVLASSADSQTRHDLARDNDWIRHFARQHGIKEQDSFYHDSYFYV